MDRYDDFSAYVEARWPRLVRFAVLLGCTGAEAEDVVQSTLERCLRKWGRVSRATDRDAYVHRMIVNEFTGSRRRRWTGERPTPAVPDDSPAHRQPDATLEVEATDAVVRALQGLTIDQRAVVVLRYYAHLDEQQMATALDVPAGTVKSRLSRALAALADNPHLADLRGTR